jgi:hypothetical protein
MYPVEKFGSWLLVDELPFPCEIHTERFRNNLPNKNGKYRVFMNSTEPQPVCQPVEDVIKYHDRFDLILTKTPEILNKCKNARLFLYGGCTVNPLQPYDKKFEISFLCTSNRGFLNGYELRHELWSRQNEIKIPKLFYSSRFRPVDTNRMLPDYTIEGKEKIHIFSSMFSICPENFSEINYFTEKIIDCFWTKTVPVYWGCPNIDSYFDSRGIIKFHSIDELIQKSNDFTPELYNQMLPYIQENWKRSISYLFIHKRVREAILKVYNENNGCNLSV